MSRADTPGPALQRRPSDPNGFVPGKSRLPQPRTELQVDLLCVYTRLWGACELLCLEEQCNGAILILAHSKFALAVVAVSILAAMVHPTVQTFGVALLMKTLLRAWAAPLIFDSEVWCGFTDVAVVLVMLQEGCGYDVRWRGSAREHNSLVTMFSHIGRLQMAIFYAAAGFWKINTSFLDPRTSCAPIFAVSLISEHCPAWLMHPALIWVAVRASPIITILVELGAGVAMAIPTRRTLLIGLGLTLLLHTGISFTPAPNGIASFSALSVTRMFFLFPEATSRALPEVFNLSKPFSIATILTLAVLAPMTKAVGPQRVPAIFFAGQLVLYVRTMIIAGTLCEPMSLVAARTGEFPRGSKFLLALAAFYAFGSQVLGLIDMGAASPFASIRLQGGSNHLLVSTNILQGRVSGDIVRVEFTDSVHMNSLYPADNTEFLPQEVVKLLRQHGHIGRQFNPTPRRVLGPEFRKNSPHIKPGGDTKFLPYTVPALELRRLLAEARALNETFVLSYTKLHGAGDESWRLSSGDENVVLYDTPGNRFCTSNGVACSKDELALMPELGFWARKVSLYFPLPVVPSASPELPCMD